tara:strand:+ start:102 stop:1580 length:1479 start_codon:yes stop_codon:yes gene_type:complete
MRLPSVSLVLTVAITQAQECKFSWKALGCTPKDSCKLKLAKGLCVPASNVTKPAKATKASKAKPSTPLRVPLIYDMDGNYDDTLVLYHLSRSPIVNLRAITLAANGFATQHGGPVNMAAAAKQFGLADVPIAYGEGYGLTDISNFPLQWRVEIDLWYERCRYEVVQLDGKNATLLPPDAAPRSLLTSHQLIAKVLRSSRTPVAILATGPLSNIARAIQRDQSLLARVSAVFVMGSNYHSDPKLSNNVYHWQMSWGGRESGCLEATGEEDDRHLDAEQTRGCRGAEMSEVGDTEWNVFLDVKAWDVLALALLEHPAVRTYMLTSSATLHMPVTRDGMTAQSGAVRDPRSRAFLISLAEQFTNAGEAKWWDAHAAVMMTEVLAGIQGPTRDSAEFPDSTDVGSWPLRSDVPSVCGGWIRSDGWGVGLEWRSLVQAPKRNPYGKVHDVGSARGPAADFCVAGNVTRMEELFWNAEDIGEVAEPAFYLRKLPPVRV